MRANEPLNVGHFWLDRVVEYIYFGADGVQFQQGAFGKAGEGVLPEVEFQHAGEVLPGGQVRGDVGFGPVEGGRKGLGAGAGGFDGAELFVILFSVIQEIPHQKCGSSKCQRVESPENVPIHFNHNPFFTLNRWARHAKVELSSAAGFSGLSVPQIGAERKNWKDESFFRE